MSSRAVSPLWLECASSTITAYRRFAISASHAFARAFSPAVAASCDPAPAACSNPRSTNGNFCNVVTTIRVPSISAAASCLLSRSMALTTPWACSIW